MTEQQRHVVSADYTRECITAQLAARGLPLDSKPVPTCGDRPFDASAPLWLQDASLSPEDWSSKAAVHFNTAFRSCGNHLCMKRVCYKGKHGKKGLCRMLYWHWRLCPSRKKPGKKVWKRVKGRLLQARVCVAAQLPPVEENPPQRGMPAVETCHGFAC